MTLKSSLRKRTANVVASKRGVLGLLLRDERVLKYMADNPELLYGGGGNRTRRSEIRAAFFSPGVCYNGSLS